MKIGVLSDCFRAGFVGGVEKAAALGVKGLQVYMVSGEMAPETITPERAKEINALLDKHGLVISAVCGDLGGHGFMNEQDNPAKIARSKQIVDAAELLGVTVVTTHIGVVPEDKNSPRYNVLKNACRELGEYAGRKGMYFAIETGPETAEHLKAFLDDVGVKGMAVNLDPANLVMVTADDPVKAVYTLKDYIVHTHAKDGRQLKPCQAEKIYGAFAEGGIEDMRIWEYFIETPLGEGTVDYPAYLAALKEIGYDGFLTIEREVGDNPEGDIKKAVDFLGEKLQNLK